MQGAGLLCALVGLFCLCACVSAQGTAYCTYHLYTADESLNSVSCSDGQHGLETRWGYTNLEPLFPYVSAWSQLSWNNPQCGSCIRLKNVANGNTISITGIDQCGPPPWGQSHFDVSKEAFTTLFGNEGINAGHGNATWEIVAGSNCKGNKG